MTTWGGLFGRAQALPDDGESIWRGDMRLGGGLERTHVRTMTENEKRVRRLESLPLCDCWMQSPGCLFLCLCPGA